MRRAAALIMAVALLCGCGASQGAQAAPAVPEETVQQITEDAFPF